MAAPSLDNEFMQLWSKLTVLQKESLLSVAKNYIDLKEADGISVKQYNRELEEAMKRMDAGEFYTQEQVVAVSKSWMDVK